MFVGHAAVALAAKPLAPERSLGVLLGATLLLDLVWPVLLLAGVERVAVVPGHTAFAPLAFVHYPWTHSLLMSVGWGLLCGLVVLRGRVRPVRELLLMSALVVSHWVLDAVAHRPDLPLVPGLAPVVGLGLWRSVPATFIVEGALFGWGVSRYVRATRAENRTGSWALWTLCGLMVVIWASGPFSPPPPNAVAIGLVGLLSWLLPAWAWWADRHRVSVRNV